MSKHDLNIMQNQQSPPPSSQTSSNFNKDKKNFFMYYKNFFRHQPPTWESERERRVWKKYEKIINKLFFLFLSHTPPHTRFPEHFFCVFLVHFMDTEKEKHTKTHTVKEETIYGPRACPCEIFIFCFGLEITWNFFERFEV
jgi:hypothetical protein